MPATFLIVLLSLAWAVRSARSFRLSPARSVALWLWHTVTSLAYLDFIQRYDGDALGYFDIGLSGDASFGIGTAFIGYLSSFLFGTLGLSLFDGFLIFGLAGFIGVQYLHRLIVETAGGRSPMPVLAVLPWLPGLHFWTSALGKDSISFLGIAWMVHASLQHRRRWPQLLAGLLLVAIIRPHVGFFGLIAALVAMLLSGRASLLAKGVTLLAGAIAVARLLPMLAEFVGLADVGSLVDVSSGIEERQGYNLEGGGSVDIAQMSLPAQLFTYLFRPLFFDASTLPMLASSVENLLLLGIFVAALVRIRKLALYEDRFAVFFNVAFLVCLWLVLATTTANLGISVRQKTMLMPSLAFLFAICLSRRRRGAPRAQRLRRTERPPPVNVSAG